MPQRELERLPLQFHGHQVSYHAIQRVMATVQIALNARDHRSRVLFGERHLGQGGEVELDGRDALLDVVVELAGDPFALRLGRPEPRRRHPAKHIALSEAAHDADDQQLARPVRRRAEASLQKLPGMPGECARRRERTPKRPRGKVPSSRA